MEKGPRKSAERYNNQRLEKARALLAALPPPEQPAPEVPGPTLPAPGALPICPHCGWATLVLVRVVNPERFVPRVALADTS